MARRTNRDEGISCLALHHRIDGGNRTAGGEHRSIERLHRDHRVRVETIDTVGERIFDSLEMLFCMRRLHDSLLAFSGVISIRLFP